MNNLAHALRNILALIRRHWDNVLQWWLNPHGHSTPSLAALENRTSQQRVDIDWNTFSTKMTEFLHRCFMDTPDEITESLTRFSSDTDLNYVIKILWANLDRNGNKRVDIAELQAEILDEELLDQMTQIIKSEYGSSEESLSRLFLEKFEARNTDGELSFDLFETGVYQHVCSSMGRDACGQVSTRTIRKLFDSVNASRTGTIQEQEFKDYFLDENRSQERETLRDSVMSGMNFLVPSERHCNNHDGSHSQQPTADHKLAPPSATLQTLANFEHDEMTGTVVFEGTDDDEADDDDRSLDVLDTPFGSFRIARDVHPVPEEVIKQSASSNRYSTQWKTTTEELISPMDNRNDYFDRGTDTPLLEETTTSNDRTFTPYNKQHVYLVHAQTQTKKDITDQHHADVKKQLLELKQEIQAQYELVKRAKEELRLEEEEYRRRIASRERNLALKYGELEQERAHFQEDQRKFKEDMEESHRQQRNEKNHLQVREQQLHIKKREILAMRKQLKDERAQLKASIEHSVPSTNGDKSDSEDVATGAVVANKSTAHVQTPSSPPHPFSVNGDSGVGVHVPPVDSQTLESLYQDLMHSEELPTPPQQHKPITSPIRLAAMLGGDGESSVQRGGRGKRTARKRARSTSRKKRIFPPRARSAMDEYQNIREHVIQYVDVLLKKRLSPKAGYSPKNRTNVVPFSASNRHAWK